MLNIELRDNLGIGFATTLALANNANNDTNTPTAFANVYLRFEDQPDMRPILVGRVNKDATLETSFDSKGQAVRLFLQPVQEDGKRPITDFAQMVQTVVEPVREGFYEIIAGEALTAGNFINLYLDGSTVKMQKANATNNTKRAQGYVLANVSSGATGKAYFEGINNALSGLTKAGNYFLSTTGGAITTTAPTGSGNIQQQLGVALSDTELQFEPQPFIEVV